MGRVNHILISRRCLWILFKLIDISIQCWFNPKYWLIVIKRFDPRITKFSSQTLYLFLSNPFFFFFQTKQPSKREIPTKTQMMSNRNEINALYCRDVNSTSLYRAASPRRKWTIHSSPLSVDVLFEGPPERTLREI